MTKPVAFKARAHLLKLLGDELIGDDRLAIFELVKNAYDADADRVDVTLDLHSGKPKIVVQDFNGDGMAIETILNKWMEIGTNSKRGENRERTTKYGRLPLGEKGVGRLAVHKLGSDLKINTRSKNEGEIEININWPSLIDNAKYIQDTEVKISELKAPVFFKGEETGTRIEITNLANDNWSRGEFRRLKRLLTSLVSPFSGVSDFDVNLYIPGHEKDIQDSLEASDILERSIWKFDFKLDENGGFSYEYYFTPPSLFKELSSREEFSSDDRLELTGPDKDKKKLRSKNDDDKLFVNSSDLDGIGCIEGTFFIYLRDRKVLNATGSYQTVKDYLDEQSGVRIYRDGIRVFNYGEKYDDWLDLNLSRINRPGKKVGTNMVIANISLDLELSFGLKEKTNREGFDNNSTYQRFKWIVGSAVDKFYGLHDVDRERITDYLKGISEQAKPDPASKFSDNLEAIRKSLRKYGLEKEIGGKVDQIEADYMQMRDVTLTSGIAGINLAVIFHEVERGIDDLNQAIKNEVPRDALLIQSSHLASLLEGFAPLLRKNEQKKFPISKLVSRVITLSEHRFNHHNVTISNPINTSECKDFEIRGPFGLLQACLTNLIDNSIHWTKYRLEKEGSEYKPAIRIFTLLDWFKEGPALVVVDNGPGFEISPEEAVKPFRTTRPAGMGVGLYYSDKVMETIGGRLLITSGEDLELPPAYSGAAVVLIFKGVKD